MRARNGQYSSFYYLLRWMLFPFFVMPPPGTLCVCIEVTVFNAIAKWGAGFQGFHHRTLGRRLSKSAAYPRKRMWGINESVCARRHLRVFDLSESEVTDSTPPQKLALPRSSRFDYPRRSLLMCGRGNIKIKSGNS